MIDWVKVIGLYVLVEGAVGRDGNKAFSLEISEENKIPLSTQYVAQNLLEKMLTPGGFEPMIPCMSAGWTKSNILTI